MARLDLVEVISSLIDPKSCSHNGRTNNNLSTSNTCLICKWIVGDLDQTSSRSLDQTRIDNLAGSQERHEVGLERKVSALVCSKFYQVGTRPSPSLSESVALATYFRHRTKHVWVMG